VLDQLHRQSPLRSCQTTAKTTRCKSGFDPASRWGSSHARATDRIATDMGAGSDDPRDAVDRVRGRWPSVKNPRRRSGERGQTAATAMRMRRLVDRSPSRATSHDAVKRARGRSRSAAPTASCGHQTEVGLLDCLCEVWSAAEGEQHLVVVFTRPTAHRRPREARPPPPSRHTRT